MLLRLAAAHITQLRIASYAQTKFIALLGGTVATWSPAAAADQVGKAVRVGYIGTNREIPLGNASYQASSSARCDGLVSTRAKVWSSNFDRSSSR